MELKHYDELARLEETHWWHLARQAIIIDFLQRYLSKLGFTSRAKLLDIGCGTGKMLRLLKRVAEPTGIDNAPQAIAYSRRKKAGKVIMADALKLPFPKEYFEIVSAQEVLEHINDDNAAMREWKRVLRKDGVLFLTCPAYMWMWGPADKFAHHYRRYTRPQLVTLLQRNGFKIIRSSYFNTLLFSGVALIRLARKPFINPEKMTADDLARSFDFYIGPSFLNGILRWIFALERHLLRWFDLPFGVSIIILAQKV